MKGWKGFSPNPFICFFYTYNIYRNKNVGHFLTYSPFVGVAKVVTKALKGMCLGLPNSLLGVGVSVVKYLILLSCVLNVMRGLRILDESKTSTSYLYAPCKGFLGWAFDHASTAASSSTVDSDSLRAQQTVGDTVWVDVSHKQKPTHRKKTTSDKPKKH